MITPSTEPEPYKYFAFISYSRKDSSAAKWLQKRLEWFRFPVKLVEVSNRPLHAHYIRPVYRDKTNLEVDSQNYWENIKISLEQSRFLIVLCSPESATSGPVDKEVRHFTDTRENAIPSILPVILRGRVASNDGESCLCPALKELGEIITSRNLPSMIQDHGDQEKEGWENGFVGVLAYLLKIQRSMISDHLRREQRIKVGRTRMAAGVMALLALGVGIFAYLATVRKKIVESQLVEASLANHAVGERLQREATGDERNPLKTSKALAYMALSIDFHPQNYDANRHASSMLTQSVLERRLLALRSDVFANYNQPGTRLLLTDGGSKSAEVYDIGKNSNIAVCPISHARVEWSKWLPDRLVVRDENAKKVHLWNPDKPQDWNFSIQFEGQIMAIAQSEKSDWVAVATAEPNVVQFLSLDTGKISGESIALPSAPVYNSLSLSSSGDYLAVQIKGEDKSSVHIIDRKQGRIISTQTSLGEIRNTMWTPQNDLVVITHAGVTPSEFGTWSPICDQIEETDYTPAFSPSRQFLVTGNGKKLTRWDLHTGVSIDLTVPLALGALAESAVLAWSPDGSLFAAAWVQPELKVIGKPEAMKHSTLIQLYDNHVMKPVGQPFSIYAPVREMIFTPECNWLIAADPSGVARMINPSDGTMIGAPFRANASISSIAVGKDGRTMILNTYTKSVTEGSYLQLWALADGVFPGEPLDPKDAEALMGEFSDIRYGFEQIDKQTVQVFDRLDHKVIGQPLKHESEIESEPMAGAKSINPACKLVQRQLSKRHTICFC